MNRRKFITHTGYIFATALIPGSFLTINCKGKNADAGYVAANKENVLKWIETVAWNEKGWGRWKYNLHMMRDYGLESSGMAIKIYDMLNSLDQIPEEKKQQAIAFFQSCQNPNDKYFKDPLVTKEDKVSDHHTWEHIWAHMSGAAIGALNILNAKPLYKREKPPFIDLDSVDVKKWILDMQWENPWMYGEHFSRAVKAYWDNLPEQERTLDHPVIQKAFATIEKYVLDDNTGMPIKRGCNNKAIAMAGLFKTMMAYIYCGKPVPNAKKALDYVLALQKVDGEFGDGDVTHNMCINWDSLWVIHKLNKQLEHNYRLDDIKNVGNKLAEYLLTVHHKEDGGFSFHPQHCQANHNSIRISKKYKESDMQGTLMCLKCFSYADEWNNI